MILDQEWIGLWKVGVVTYQNIARHKHKFVHYGGQTDGNHICGQNVVAEGQVHFQVHFNGNISSSNPSLFLLVLLLL